MQAPDISEITRLAHEADKIDKRRAELFASMVKTEGWQEYIKLLEAKIQIFSDGLLPPAGSIDGMVKCEWIKGAMGGLIMARDVASATMAAAEELRRQDLTQAEGYEDE